MQAGFVVVVVVVVVVCVCVCVCVCVICLSHLQGPECKSAVIEQKNQERVAFHEGGCAIVALYTPGTYIYTPKTVL